MRINFGIALRAGSRPAVETTVGSSGISFAGSSLHSILWIGQSIGVKKRTGCVVVGIQERIKIELLQDISTVEWPEVHVKLRLKKKN